jgi:PTS system cellobiose-specific IIC component
MKDSFMNGLLTVAGKMQSNPVLSAIKDGFIDIMPVTIMGSFCTLFQFVVSATKANGYDISLANVPGLGWLANLNPVWSTANYGCMNFMAVMVVFMVALHFAENIGRPGDKTAAAVALASFITLVTTSVTGKSASGEEVTISGAVASTYTNSNGLFVAIIVGIVVTWLYVKLISSGKLTIKLPDSVPPNVSQSFAVLFPTVITIFVVALVNWIMSAFLHLDFFSLINRIMAPIQAIMTGLPGYLVVVFLMMLLWWFGIHGPNVMSAVTTPFMTAAWTNNEAIYKATGQVAINTVGPAGEKYQIINTVFGAGYFSHTGSGITGGLIIAVMLFSKREDYRAICKLAIPCGIFNINEPIIFGIPMVMNPLLGIPFFLAPVVSVVFGYLITKIGFAPMFVINVPWTTPCGIFGFLASGGRLMGAISQLLAFATSILVYMPFVLASNAQQEEAAA